MAIRVPLACLLLVPLLLADGPSAAALYEKGLKAEKAGHMAEAYLLYSQAYAEDPANRTYWLRSQAVKSRAGLQAMPSAAPVATATLSPSEGSADDDAPAPPLQPATLRDRMDARQPLPPTELDALSGVMDIDLRGDSRKLFEDLAHLLGLDCVFDRDYQPVAPFRFKLDRVTYRDALHGLEAATGSFIVPITSRIFLVAKDTQQKRLELEPHVAVATHIDETTTPQDFTSIVTAVQQTFAVERVGFDTQNNTVIFKGPISKVLPARDMFEELMHPRAQVMVEFRFLEASRNDTLTWGMQVPTGAALTTAVQTLANLAHISSSTVYLAYTAVQAAFVAQMTKGTARTLLDSQVRAIDGQAATLHIGDKFPILTGAYSGVSTSAGYYPPFTFEDLGLNLKVTPTVHSSEEVSLDLEAEVKALTGQATDGIPVISHRELKSRTRLRVGEWTMVTGLLSPTEAHSITGVAGLSRIPYIGPAFSVRDRQRTEEVELVLIRPTLLTLPPSEYPTHKFYTGSEARPLSPL